MGRAARREAEARQKARVRARYRRWGYLPAEITDRKVGIEANTPVTAGSAIWGTPRNRKTVRAGEKMTMQERRAALKFAADLEAAWATAA